MPEVLLASQAGTNSLASARLVPDSVDTCGGEIANQLASLLGMPCVQNPYRHELIDVTRSLRHRQLHGRLSRNCLDEQKQQLIEVAYLPYRERIETAIESVLDQSNFVVHLSVRTFDLREGDKLLRTDVGLLYDPGRDDELNLCINWICELYDVFPNLRVRRNYPRCGTVDSLTKAMRERFPADQYLGIEVWMNRAWATRKVRLRDEAMVHLAEALRVTIGVAES